MSIENFIDRVIEGDALKLLPELPDKSIDLCLTDPPYGIEEEPSVIVRNGGKFGKTRIFTKG